MEPIKNLVPQSLEMLGRPTKASQRSMPVLAVFNDFRTLGDRQLIKMLAAANQFARDMLDKKAPYWLSLVGSSGAGKTMLTRLIYRNFRELINATVIYESPALIVRAHGEFFEWTKLINRVRDGNHRLFQDVCDDYFVCMDEIGGAGYETPFTVAKLYEFMNARQGKWTVFTSNKTLEQLSEIDARISSRMIRGGSVVVDVDVQDYNMRAK